MSSDNSQIMNEIGLLNVRLNDFMNQLNRTVKVMLDENQKLTTELQQLKETTNTKTENKKP